MSLRVIIKDDNNINSLTERRKRSFAYFVFQVNAVVTDLVKDEWRPFATPTNPMTAVFDHCNDFEPQTTGVGFKFIGNTNKWFNLSAVTNVFKGSGGQTRTIELQWKLNESFVGFSRQSQCNTESNIFTGNGLVFLQPNDKLTAWVCNVENDDGVRLDNASFTLSEEQLYYY